MPRHRLSIEVADSYSLAPGANYWVWESCESLRSSLVKTLDSGVQTLDREPWHVNLLSFQIREASDNSVWKLTCCFFYCFLTAATPAPPLARKGSISSGTIIAIVVILVVVVVLIVTIVLYKYCQSRRQPFQFEVDGDTLRPSLPSRMKNVIGKKSAANMYYNHSEEDITFDDRKPFVDHEDLWRVTSSFRQRMTRF